MSKCCNGDPYCGGCDCCIDMQIYHYQKETSGSRNPVQTKQWVRTGLDIHRFNESQETVDSLETVFLSSADLRALSTGVGIMVTVRGNTFSLLLEGIKDDG